MRQFYRMKNIALWLIIASCKPQSPGAASSVNSRTAESVKWVAIAEGLRLRETPDLQGKILRVLPQYSRLVIVAEKPEKFSVSGTQGNWANIKFGETSGWAFTGFMTDIQPTNQQLFAVVKARFPGLFGQGYAREPRDPLSGNVYIRNGNFVLGDGGAVLEGKISRLNVAENTVELHVDGSVSAGQDASSHTKNTASWDFSLKQSAQGLMLGCSDNLLPVLKTHCGKTLVPAEF